MDPVDDIKESDREVRSRDAADDAGDVMDPVDPGREIPVLMLGKRVLGGRAAQELGHLVLFPIWRPVPLSGPSG